MTSKDEVLSYWIGQAADDAAIAGSKTKLWFMSSPAADDKLRELFGELLKVAEQGKLESWATDPRGSLALVILLDQFSRNLYRGTAKAFANDAAALDLSRKLVENGQHRDLKTIERVFLYLPFEHAESAELQQQSVELFQALIKDSEPKWHPQLEAFTDHAIEHQNIIIRFGRFPHRNAVLGRTNTVEEKLYLESAKTFGQ